MANNDRFKFRVWNKDRNRMHMGSIDNICIALGGHLMWQFGFNSPQLLTNEESKNCILMQSTGLKDSEGELIYEGDILQSDDKEFTVKVVWVDEETRFKTIMVGAEQFDFELNVMSVLTKIIGNIYENPELIENKINKTKEVKETNHVITRTNT